MAGFIKTVTFMVLVFAAVVSAEDYKVGDDEKWARPSDLEFYNTWAAGKTFQVGDELEFDFDAQRHDVAIVTADAYENCEKETPLSIITTSPAKIMLNDTGPIHFICTVADHCRFGQKLTVIVGDEGSGHSGGAIATPPSTGEATPPAPGGATSPKSGGATTPAPGGATAPGAGGAAPTTPGAGTTAPTGSKETATPPADESTASSLGGGASLLVAFVSAVVVALF
ncbi:unnamed protein product [Eruca vesicaria subsp. sativa]|uniref:Phytocyanin domain-containing protein n=1 Tax=Eruca vesicaria subsp. sativa TaxID=29727 RepID=A0ABC8INS5_ERUVS|nr:unnamed protein product [Eruca vesicaria subsp. sativa]